MYDFWYNKIKSKHGLKAQLLYTDTDSLLFELETSGIYMNVHDSSEYYDFNEYPKDHRWLSESNKKVVEQFKGECNGRPIHEFVGLRPKMYSVLETSRDSKMRAKGVKIVVNKDHKHKSHKRCLDDPKEMNNTQVRINSQGH